MEKLSTWVKGLPRMMEVKGEVPITPGKPSDPPMVVLTIRDCIPVPSKSPFRERRPAPAPKKSAPKAVTAVGKSQLTVLEVVPVPAWVALS